MRRTEPADRQHAADRPLADERLSGSGFRVRFPTMEAMAVLLILFIGMAAVIGISVLTTQLETDARVDQSGNQSRVLSANAASAMMTLAAQQLQSTPATIPPASTATTSPATLSPEWTSRLQSDPDALGTFILRLTTAPGYVRQQKDDTAFVQDVTALLTIARSANTAGTTSTTGAATIAGTTGAANTASNASTDSVIPAWTDGQSRVVWLQTALQALGFSADGLPAAPANDGQLTELKLSSTVPASGSVIFGRRTITGTIQSHFDGLDSAAVLTTRLSLFLDGAVLDTSPFSTVTGPATDFSLWLDARGQSSGSHQAEVFIIGSDGRGFYGNIGTLKVPVIAALSAGGVLKQTVPATGEAQYAVLPAAKTSTGWHYAVSAVDSNGPIAAELYDLDGQLIASSDNRDTQWEGLRATRPANTAADQEIPAEDRIAYARITGSGKVSTGAAAKGSIAYTLVQSDSVAVSKTKPEQVYAVIEKREDGLVLQGADGQRQTKKESEVRLVDFTARLSELTLSNIDGTTSVYPLFDPETTDYGLYLAVGSGSLSFHVSPREGSFATVTVVHESDSARDRPLKAVDTLFPESSENTLAVTVRNGDGAERTYRIHILLPPQKDGYHQVLEAFPESYRSPLYLLHVLHPAYQFVADQTNLTFTAFLDAEAYKDRSLVDSSSAPSSWVLTGSPVYDGKSWKAASRKVVAHYGDPRNFLNEQDIFQFETLRFQRTTHTRAALESILSDTFMDPANAKNPDKIDYASLIQSAGEKADLSPLFIAAKIIQEMGRTGVSPLAFGRLPGYEGAFNFYNIGSTPNPAVANGAQINGALYALYGRTPAEKQITPDEEVYLLPWTTPERAITGGAIWIASRYIAIGQDTLYLQKFDLVAADELYIHQYAQNIQMAYAEGRRTYTAYRDMKLLDAAFVFRIPVFLEMPEAWSALPS